MKFKYRVTSGELEGTRFVVQTNDGGTTFQVRGELPELVVTVIEDILGREDVYQVHVPAGKNELDHEERYFGRLVDNERLMQGEAALRMSTACGGFVVFTD